MITRSLAHSLTRSLAHSLTRSLAHSLTRSLALSLRNTRTTIPLALMLSLSACGTLLPERPDVPHSRDPSCLPTVDASATHEWDDAAVGAVDAHLGTALATIQHGTNGTPDLLQELVIGAPDAPQGGGGSGLVRITGRALSAQTPNVDITTVAQTLSPPFVGDVRYGSALHSVDLADGLEGGVSVPGGEEHAFGMELLVGAPRDAGTTDPGGRVHWYYAKADTSVIDRTDSDFHFGGTLEDPALAATDFGFAIAAGTHLNAANPWVAVGAPGTNQVFIFPYDPASTSGAAPNVVPDPFAGVTPVIISASSLGLTGASRLGASLLAYDVDRDGEDELIIGAPGGSVEQVVVVQDVSNLQDWNSVDSMVVDSGRTSSDAFGASLAAGDLYGESVDVVVAVGKPEADVSDPDSTRRLPDVTNMGGVCFFQVGPANTRTSTFGSPSSSLDCYDNPEPFEFAVGDERFGTSLAIANVVHYDNWGHRTTDQAEIPELLVGEPGGRARNWEDLIDGKNDTQLDDDGHVNIFRGGQTWQGDARIQRQDENPEAYNSDLFPLRQLGYPGAASGAQEAGVALAVTQTWPAGGGNVFVGAPGVEHVISSTLVEGGAVLVTDDEPVNGWDHTDGGFYETEDSAGTVHDVRVTRPDDLQFSVAGDFDIQLVKTSDHNDVCETFQMPLFFNQVDYTPGDPPKVFVKTVQDGSGNEFSLRFEISSGSSADGYDIEFKRACKGGGCDFTGTYLASCDILHADDTTGPIEITRKVTGQEGQCDD
jgi:hypothetical protein